ncbi:DUF1127 domain-containing protein [Aureimonas glaciei]|uniref:DUF1127 domain-containing protein n=1 Tax=Aureimonas glaciei TaxID=1776957 RepID=UPI00166C395B
MTDRSSLRPSTAGQRPFLSTGTATAWIGRIYASPGNLLSRFCRGLRARQAVRELAALDDHMLRDIGLLRTDIEHVVQTGRFPGECS